MFFDASAAVNPTGSKPCSGSELFVLQSPKAINRRLSLLPVELALPGDFGTFEFYSFSRLDAMLIPALKPKLDVLNLNYCLICC